ncbi:MAG: DNA-deoxyinosine glycosylase [Lachnospiraceae bacterium]
MKKERIKHNFEPVFDENAKVLILGTFPSVKSREQQFYYGHPQNRFWKLLALLTEEDVPQTISEKKEFLLRNGIAIWDVVQSCTIEGSSDSSIRDVVANDISTILEKAQIREIFTNGGKAFELYKKYIYPVSGIDAIKLPSTSPANAAFSMERLTREWEIVKKRLK